jgi:hypothetical protein
MQGFFPTVFDNTTPHILVLKKSCPYYGLIELYRDIYDKLGVILPFTPCVNQVYQWLLELIDIPSQLRVKFSAGLSEEKQILVWRSVHSGALSARYKDFMWRLSSGSLKTGEVLARWNMPWVNTECVYCKGGLETVTHLFVTCKELQSARDLLAWYAQQFLDMEIDTERELAMLNAVFSDRVGHNEGDPRLRHLVVALNKII